MKSATELRQHLDTLLMPAVPAPDLQRYSSAQMPRSADASVRQSPAAPSERKTSFPTRPPSPGGAAAKKNEADRNDEADKNVRSTSRTPLFIGLGAAAAIGIGAFVMFGGGGRAVSPKPPPGAVGDSALPSKPAPPPAKVSEPPKPEPKPVVVTKAPEPPKPAAADPKQEAPKPAMAAASSGRAAAPPAAASVTAATNAEKAPATPGAALGGPSAPPSAPPAATGTAQGTERATLPAELAALDAQFIVLQKERITAPFEADAAKLNASYLGGIGKKIAEEKAAGHLDGILALEAEKQTVERVFNSFSAGGATAGNELKTRSTNPVPETDDDKTPASLKALRAIYRKQFAKISATRDANLKTLLDPLDKRLAAMETDFTKADRLADAKTVRGYREVLNESGPLSPLSGTSGAVAANTPPTPAQGTERTTINPAAVLALKDGITNTLGMKFLPVKGTDVLFCIHETRRQDYAAYANEVPGVDGAWKSQNKDGIPVSDKDDHPVVAVSHEDAQKFCEWLSKKEGRTYRLPTDEEWSIAVGLGRKEKHGKGITPEMLHDKETTEYPWGGDYPPKTKDKAGNYADESWHEKFPTQSWMENYSDGFPTTAPVMSFKPNKLGLYDMGGNVWEWVDNWWNAAQKDRVLRGGSWYCYVRGNLLSSHRLHIIPGFRYNDRGFRLVLAPSGGSPKSD